MSTRWSFSNRFRRQLRLPLLGAMAAGCAIAAAALIVDPLAPLGPPAGTGPDSAPPTVAQLEARLVALTLLGLAMMAAILALLGLVWRLHRQGRRRARNGRATLNRLRAILKTSQDGILVLRPDGRVLHCNAAARRMIALPGHAPAALDVSAIFSRRDAAGALVPVTGARLLQNTREGPQRCDNLVIRALDGHSFPAEISCDIARQGEETVVVCFVRDVSERAAAETEIARARDRALEGERAKARFLGMISHEMRTPLNGVLGALDLLEESDLDAAQDRYVQVMKSSGQLLLEQINDALEVTQTGRERPGLRPAPFDFDALVHDLVASQEPLARARGTRLSLLRPDTPVGHVLGDRGRVHQILLNLVSNAVKFTHHGAIRVEVTPRPRSARGRTIEVQVSDTGIGISPEDLPSVFDDFVRLEGDGDDAAPGTGLGLGIARQLTELMDGHIGAESVRHEGSLFWVCLPLPPVPGDGAPRATAPMRVLVADDNSHVRLVLRDMLEKDGHSVQAAADGLQALAAAEAAAFDLIVMDLAMPGLDGVAAIGRIRRGGGPSAGARIVALTAHLRPDQATALHRAGVDAVHTKPLRRAALRGLVGAGAPPAGGRAPAAPGAAAALIDRAQLGQLHDSLPAASYARLLDGFAQEVDAVLDAIAPDGPAPSQGLAARLHRLAGSAGTVGAFALQRQLCRAEAAAARGDAAALRRAMRPLPWLWQRTRGAIARHRRAA